MPFFDFHCHPGFKPLLAPAGQEPTPWKSIKAELTILGSSVGINKLFNKALNSQSSLGQLVTGKVNLVGTVLYATEKQMGVGVLQKKIAAAGDINVLDPGKLTIISRGDNYYKLTKDNVEILLNHPTPGAGDDMVPAGSNFKFIKSIDEYEENNLNTIHGVAIVEGMHSFANDVFSANVENDIVNNLNDFIQRYSDRNVRIFAANITHLQHLPFGAHASGLQFISDSLFFPEVTGLTALGKNIVKLLHDKKILVDIKHMAFSTRTALYAFRDINQLTQPIICTHAGIAGCRMDERLNFLRSRPKRVVVSVRNPPDQVAVWEVEHLKPKGHVKAPNGDRLVSAFNVSSINLYDEDIIKILDSKGLIGISLDQRIVGYPAESVAHGIDVFPSEVEYISEADAATFFGPMNPAALEVFDGDFDKVLRGSEAEDHNFATHDSHARYFLNQVIHILRVGKEAGILNEAAKRVCIGSDFDGLINAIDCCETAMTYDQFKRQLKDIMEENRFWNGTGIAKGEVDVDELLEGLFFKNAFEFLKVNFV
ncbi:MAG TPA: hypothetical protein VD993_14290 [Chitinophagaceae bacterium]|nr:hypothetical protein [Chitinophagaceae bacterium]